MNILIIGGGNMGFTYAKGILDAQIKNTRVSILEPQQQRRTFLSSFNGFHVYENPQHCVGKADIVLLSVKPQICLNVFKELRSFLNNDQIIISIMAGVTIDTISKHLKLTRIVRAMPNLPAQLGKGMTGYFASDAIDDEEKELIAEILKTTGSVLSLTNETAIDAVTGISGSGPAYVFYFMEAMVQAALEMGFDQDDAKKLVSQTFEGAVTQFKASQDSLPIWIDRVTSKGGTTQAALEVLRKEQVASHIKKASIAAQQRANELAKSIL